MAKKEKDKKAKLKKGKHDKVKTASTQAVLQVDTSQGAYADGAPLDRVQYLEAKLILKPDHFTSIQAFRDFGKIVKQTAKQLGIGFIADPNADQRPAAPSVEDTHAAMEG